MDSGVIECCAKNCFSSMHDSTLQFFSFHDDVKTTREYLDILGRKDLMSLPIEVLQTNYFFCEKHILEDPDEVPQVSNNQWHHPSQTVPEVLGSQSHYQSQVLNSQSHHSSHLDLSAQSFQSTAINFAEYHEVPHANVFASTSAYDGYQAYDENNVSQRVACYQRSLQTSNGPRTCNTKKPRSRHQNKPSDDIPRCHSCKKMFDSLKRFRSHMLRYHKTLFCEYCKRVYQSKYYLNLHQKLHCQALKYCSEQGSEM